MCNTVRERQRKCLRGVTPVTVASCTNCQDWHWCRYYCGEIWGWLRWLRGWRADRQRRASPVRQNALARMRCLRREHAILVRVDLGVCLIPLLTRHLDAAGLERTAGSAGFGMSSEGCA